MTDWTDQQEYLSGGPNYCAVCCIRKFVCYLVSIYARIILVRFYRVLASRATANQCGQNSVPVSYEHISNSYHYTQPAALHAPIRGIAVYTRSVTTLLKSLPQAQSEHSHAKYSQYSHGVWLQCVHCLISLARKLLPPVQLLKLHQQVRVVCTWNQARQNYFTAILASDSRWNLVWSIHNATPTQDTLDFLYRGAIPTQHEWPLAVVTPIQKTKLSTKMTNYRPISGLPVLSKVLERVVYSQLILKNSLSGFRPNYSTQDVLLHDYWFLEKSYWRW